MVIWYDYRVMTCLALIFVDIYIYDIGNTNFIIHYNVFNIY